MWSTAIHDLNSERGKKEQRNERWSSKRQVRSRSWKILPSSPKNQHGMLQYAGPPEMSTPRWKSHLFSLQQINRNKSLIVEGEVFTDSKFLVSNSVICWWKNNQLLQDMGFGQYKCSQEALQNTDGEEFTIPMVSPT